jgi:hypothetical protein
VVDGEDKRSARLNCISHLLSQIPYEDVVPAPIHLPPRPGSTDEHVRPPKDSQSFVPELY